MKKAALLFTSIVVLAQPIFAASNVWLGTWKFNQGKSTLTGTTYTITKIANSYHFDYGALKFDVSDDGKDYPVVPTRTASLKSTGSNEWLVVDKVNGVETSRTEIKLASDGKTETDVTTGTRADGSTYKSESKAERISGGPDIAGTWKDVKESTSASSTMVYSEAGPNQLKIDYPESKGSVLVTLDGTPVHEMGPRAVPDMTTSYKKISATELKYKVFIKDKPYYEGTQTVSADGKVLKDVGWLVTKPNEKTTAMYDKQ